MAYNIIFFDLDGTLIDPKIGILNAVQYALAKFKIKEDLKTLLPFIGPPLNKSFEKYYGFSEKKAMQAVMYYREYFLPRGLHESIVYKGIPELLEKLNKTKKALYIVTSKPTFMAEKVALHHKLDKYFKKIIGSKPDLSNAAKATLIKKALTLNPEKQSVVMIGDREHDIIGARANKIDSIGVLYGYGTFEELTKIKPTNMVKSVAELEKYLL
jgi:phosphoglycolate phosphatase